MTMKRDIILVPDSILSVKDGQKVSAGDVIARLAKRNY
jgi:DNA-directed RNA polymerase subunit beta'